MALVIHLPRDMNRFCRCCMNVASNQAGCFETSMVLNNELTEFCRMFQSVTLLNVFQKDGLPETVCSSCAEQITAMHVFVNQCKDTEKNLKQLLTLAAQSQESYEATEDSNSNIMCDTHKCQDCEATFTSYYDLSLHKIHHNANKNLLDKLEGSSSNNIALDTITDAYVASLIEERKDNYTSAIVNTSEKNNSDKPIKEDTMDKGTLKILNDDDDLKTWVIHKNQCEICKKKFKTRKELLTHVCKLLSNRLECKNSCTDCVLCKKKLSNVSLLSLHFLSHAFTSLNVTEASIEGEFFFCEVCGQTLDTQQSLNEHYEAKHDGKPFWPCPNCSNVYEKESDLLKHNDVHLGTEKYDEKGTFSCVLCNQMFTVGSSLLKHSVEHLMKKYSCKKCLSSFCTQHSYSEHVKGHLANRYDCPKCGKFLSSKSALKCHIIGVHSSEQSHLCTICGKKFSTLGRLKTHSYIHKTDKKYVCSYCGYSTHKAGDLRMHDRIHTSERPYKCTFTKCNAAFKTSSHLCEHVRRHLQIRRFKCTICALNFSTRNSLNVHQLQHTGEKPFSCTVCHQKFRRKYHVKIHMKTHEVKQLLLYSVI